MYGVRYKMKKRIICVERKYKVQNSSGEYFIIAKREISEKMTNELLHEDFELQTFLENYDIILSKEQVLSIESNETEVTEPLISEKIKLEKKERMTYKEMMVKAKDFIRNRYREGKDWSSAELSEETGIEKSKAQQIVHRLSEKERFIVRSNPEIKSHRKYRWLKAEAMITPEGMSKEYSLEKLQEERKVIMGVIG